MDLNELNTWLETDEGKQWGEQFKAPLLKNRDLLLSELKIANSKLSEAEQRNAQTENDLSAERAVTSKYLIDNDLTALLEKANVFDVAIPHTLKTLKADYNLAVKADGDSRKAVGVLKDEKGNDIEVGLPDILADWLKEPLSKCFIKNGNAGGGALGSGFGSYIPPASSALRNISGPELAKMSDNDFSNLRGQIQTGRGEN
jgi:hypothetical protein